MATDEAVIVVVGEGSSSGASDICRIHITLDVVSESAAEAFAQVVALSESVVAALKEVGTRVVEMSTSNVSIQDVDFDHQKQRNSGRSVSYSLSLIVRSLDQVGPLLSTLLEVAGDSLRIRAIELDIADLQPLQRDARQRAVADAKSRAVQLAEAAGVTLGPIMSIEEGVLPRNRPIRAMPMAASSGTLMPIEGGTTSASVTLAVTFRLAN